MPYSTQIARARSGHARNLAATLALAVAMAALAPSTLAAQERDMGRDIPPGHLPPPGMCRVWHDGRPPGQQPRATSCAAARRDANLDGGRVIYGEERKRDDARGGDAGYPSSPPQMRWGASFARGVAVDEVRRWVGAAAVQARLTDANGDGRPEAVAWVDASGQVVQRWLDDDGDGRADRVEIYRDGRVTRVIRP